MSKLEEDKKVNWGRPMYYRVDGTPYVGPDPCMEWAKDYENRETRQVAYDVLPNKIEISTVWLGLDHLGGPGPRPLIFETAIFMPEKAEYWIYGKKFVSNRALHEMFRYSTLEEARLTHKMLLKKYSAFKSVDQVLSEK